MFRISPMRKLLVPELEFGRGAGRLRPGAVWLILVVAGLCVAAGVARHFQIARIHADDVAVVFAIMVIDAGAAVLSAGVPAQPASRLSNAAREAKEVRMLEMAIEFQCYR